MILSNDPEGSSCSSCPEVLSDLWAITTYFNPCDYQNRRRGYETFRKHLQVPLLTVELSFTGEFHLKKGDADILIQLHSSDVMWQKERLLNIGIEALPDVCVKVAWIDCDLVFGNDDWPQQASEALEQYPFIQPFEHTCDLKPEFIGPEFTTHMCSYSCESLASLYAKSLLPERYLLLKNKRAHGITPGYAWAARRDVLQRHSLYDACIVGGGDGTILAGVLGEFSEIIEYLKMNPRRAEHFMAWAEPVYQEVSGSLGFIPGTIYHLWHGDIQDRNYDARRAELEKHRFDPYEDIAIADNGCWQWSSNKPDLHRYLREYFAMRREDGRVKMT